MLLNSLYLNKGAHHPSQCLNAGHFLAQISEAVTVQAERDCVSPVGVAPGPCGGGVTQPKRYIAPVLLVGRRVAGIVDTVFFRIVS